MEFIWRRFEDGRHRVRHSFDHAEVTSHPACNEDVGPLELSIPTSCNDEANAQLTPRRANNTSVCCTKAAASA